MCVYMKECVCVATFSATHHSIALVFKEGLGFLLPVANDIFRHFAFIYLFLTGALIWYTEVRGSFGEWAWALLEGEPQVFLSQFLLFSPTSLTLRSSPIIFNRITCGSKKSEWIRKAWTLEVYPLATARSVQNYWIRWSFAIALIRRRIRPMDYMRLSLMNKPNKTVKIRVLQCRSVWRPWSGLLLVRQYAE